MTHKKCFGLLIAAFLLCFLCFVLPVIADDDICDETECVCEGTEGTKCDEFLAEEEGVSVYANGGSQSKEITENVESSFIGADLIAENNGMIELTVVESAGIYGEEIGVNIETAGAGSSVSVTSDILDSEGSGVSIDAEAGTTVKLMNTQVINGYTAVEMENNGGTVSLNTGEIDAVIGLALYSESGKTTVETNNIFVDEYGVYVEISGENTDGTAEVTVTVDGDITDETVSADPDSGYEVPDDPEVPEDESVRKDAAKDGDNFDDPNGIDWDNIKPEDSLGFKIPDDGSDIGSVLEEGETEGGNDEWENEGWEEEEISEESVNSTGVIVYAEKKGSSVNVTVSGDISMDYGNDIEAYEGSSVTVTVSGDVLTDYGNRISAEDSGSASEFIFGRDVYAGGKAIDTYSNSGSISVSVSGKIDAVDSDDSDYETIGINSNSEGSGTTKVKVGKGINVSSQEPDYTAYGIAASNIGGTITVDVDSDLNVRGADAVGIFILNDPNGDVFGEDWEEEELPYEEDTDEDNNAGSVPHDVSASDSDAQPPVTTVTIHGNASGTGGSGAEIWNSDGKTDLYVDGNLTGSEYGLDVSAFGEDRNSSFADIIVTETISGSKTSVLVNDEADNDGTEDDNLSLTVWKIENRNGHAAVTPDGKAADNIEPDIKYIVKIDPDSQDLIEAVAEDGQELATSHDFPVQTEGQKVYLKAKGDYQITGAYNGKDRQTALEQDENGDFFLSVPKGGAVWLSVFKHTEPVNPQSTIDFYPLCEPEWLCSVQLPGTGFSANHVTQLPARPRGFSYGSTGMTLQIPGLDVSEVIVTVPAAEDGSYPVEWLDSAVGLLEQSSLPGEGITVLTGHNHLNTMEVGPFLYLKTLETNDRIMITDADNAMMIYKVYGNYKIASDGFAEIADAVRKNALVLITCEDESVDGGYLNRRVILADPQ